MADTFQVNLFTDPTEYEEEPLRDRKSRLPYLRRDDEKAEFIRDIIALANTSRMFRRPAYLLYGLSNDVDGEIAPICGIGDSLNPYGTPGTTLAWEEFSKEFGQAVAEYIQPLLNPKLRHCIIGQQEVAYIQIPPLTPSTAFQTRKSIKRQFRTGEAWLRYGESKCEIKRQEIAPEDDPYRYAYSSIPYVLPSIWRRYFESILNNYHPAENLTEAQNIRGYQNLYTYNGQLLHESVEQFLNGSGTLLVIEGTAGSGKSAFIWRWVLAQAEMQLHAVKEQIVREEFLPPGAGLIPVYHRLRNEPVRANYRLDMRLLDTINANSANSFWHGKRQPVQAEELFCIPDLQWAICLDGLDEIRSPRQQATFIEALRGFVETYPRVKVILTTRPDTGISTLAGFADVVTIAPFTDQQILLYLQNWADSEDYETFVDFLGSQHELWELCRTPAYLAAACQRLTGQQGTQLEHEVSLNEDLLSVPGQMVTKGTSVSGVEIPSAPVEGLLLSEPITNEELNAGDTLNLPPEEQRPLTIGEVLYEMYTFLWRREGHRRVEFSQNETCWWLKTGKLALQMDGRQLYILETSAQKALSATGIRHVLSLGVLRRNTGTICFNTELTKAYFAASWLRDCLRTSDYAAAHRLMKPTSTEFRQRVEAILTPLEGINIQNLFQEVCDELQSR